MTQEFDSSRRRLLRAGLAGLSLRGAGAAGLGGLFGQATQALAASQNNDRILVVLELSGGNDGLNTLVPYGDDAYYRHRPTIGIAAGPRCDGQVLVLYDLLGLDDRFQPRFLKKYARLSAAVVDALQAFAAEVSAGDFPGPEHYVNREDD